MFLLFRLRLKREKRVQVCGWFFQELGASMKTGDCEVPDRKEPSFVWYPLQNFHRYHAYLCSFSIFNVLPYHFDFG